MNITIHVNDNQQIVISGTEHMMAIMCMGAGCFTTKYRNMSESSSSAYRTVMSEILEGKDLYIKADYLKATGVGKALLYKAFNQEMECFDENYDRARPLGYKDLMTGNGVNDRYRNLPSSDRIGYVVEDLVRQFYKIENDSSPRMLSYTHYRSMVEPSIRYYLNNLLDEQPKLPDSKLRYSDWGSIRVWYYAVLTHVFLAMLLSASESHLDKIDASPCADVADFWDDILEVSAVDERQFAFLQTARL